MANQGNHDNFVRILEEVCEKTMQGAMIQNARIHDLWKRHLARFVVTYRPIRYRKFDKQAFLDSVQTRISVLGECEAVMVDTYWAIKQVATTLFQYIPPELPAHFPAFKEPRDIELYVLRVSEKLVNALMAFFAREHEIVTPRTFIFGKISTYIRVKKRVTVGEIAAMLEKDEVAFPEDEIMDAMHHFQSRGLVVQDGDDSRCFVHVKKLELTPEQERIMQQEFVPVIEWAIETWRTIFNIRELNTPVPDGYANKELLEHVISYAATQGFTTAHFCFQEIKRYYESAVGIPISSE